MTRGYNTTPLVNATYGSRNGLGRRCRGSRSSTGISTGTPIDYATSKTRSSSYAFRTRGFSTLTRTCGAPYRSGAAQGCGGDSGFGRGSRLISSQDSHRCSSATRPLSSFFRSGPTRPAPLARPVAPPRRTGRLATARGGTVSSRRHGISRGGWAPLPARSA